MSEIKFILGLGNPGEEYARTRHNVGYMVTDALAEKFRGVWKPGHGRFYYAPVKIGGRDVFLLRAATYMNESGLGARDAAEQFSFVPQELLVVLDDFALPFGTLRLRPAGSDGGHNGLASVIYHLGTEKIPRLRVGIGPLPQGIDPAEFVLSDFLPQEQEALVEIISRCVDAIVVAVVRGLDRAMELYNRRPRPQDENPAENKKPDAR